MADTSKNSNRYIVILCGGTGPRLWPLSRASNPKQFLNLFSELSLLQETYNRAKGIVPEKNIYIVTNNKYTQKIKVELPQIDSSRILSEPEKKNTLMAITYAAAVIKKLNPKAVLSTFPSDHFIAKNQLFRKQIKEAQTEALKLQSFVLIGIKPTSPNPSYGYLVTLPKSSKSYLKVSQFIEKPDIPQAKLLLKKKSLWNSGIYTFSLDTFDHELKTHQPQYYQLFQKIQDQPDNSRLITKIYQLSDDLAIDIGLSQKSKNIVALTSQFIWSDVGEWKTIFAQIKKDKNNIGQLQPASHLYSVGSQNCLVHGQQNKLVGLVGVNNIAVIDTPDGLLICNLDNSFNVRELVSLIVHKKETQNFFLK